MVVSLLKWIGIALLVLVLCVALFFVGMRFHDGPRGLISGGPFTSGELSPPPEDWQFVKGRDVIEFQTLDPETSRTVWLGVLDGRLFIVSGYMNTGYGHLWKQWPHYLEEDDRIIVRVDGKLYEQRLERLMAFDRLAELMSIYAEKYGPGLSGGASAEQLQAQLTNGDFWLFEVTDR